MEFQTALFEHRPVFPIALSNETSDVCRQLSPLSVKSQDNSLQNRPSSHEGISQSYLSLNFHLFLLYWVRKIELRWDLSDGCFALLTVLLIVVLFYLVLLLLVLSISIVF